MEAMNDAPLAVFECEGCGCEYTEHAREMAPHLCSWCADDDEEGDDDG